jgi:PadR family transcriptional regulator AphA
VPRALTATSHLVLGMMAAFGPMTGYRLERVVEATVAEFWTFPHSQLHAEAARLAADGLLGEEREPGGRRRRTFAITPAGREALRAWLAEPEPERTQVRDPGMLKLFFASQAPVDRSALARDQARAHRARAEEHARRLAELRAAGVDPNMRATLELGVHYETAVAEFWEELVGSEPS